MTDLTPIFLEPEWPVEPLHILDDTCWCRHSINAGQVEGDCCCEFCLDYSLEDDEL
jgi:hypothetical protein